MARNFKYGFEYKGTGRTIGKSGTKNEGRVEGTLIKFTTKFARDRWVGDGADPLLPVCTQPGKKLREVVQCNRLPSGWKSSDAVADCLIYEVGGTFLEFLHRVSREDEVYSDWARGVISAVKPPFPDFQTKKEWAEWINSHKVMILGSIARFDAAWDDWEGRQS